MMKIRCIVERITYQNPENGYTILKCKVKDYADLVPVVGNLLDANVGSVLLVEGNWKVDTKYGRQFIAENWEETLPPTVYGMEKYLGSGLIKGVGPKFAKRIVQKYGIDTFTVIEENIQILIEVDGIGSKRVEMIAESWERQKEVKNLMLFLQEHHVSSSYAAKLGFDKESYVRLRSGLMYTLSELSNDGHVYAKKSQLIDKASELLEAAPETIIMTMDDMVQKEELILEKNIVKDDEKGNQITAIYLPPFYFAEIGIAGKLKKLASSPAGDKLFTKLVEARRNSGNDNLSVSVELIEEKVGMKYDEIQADAIRKAATAKIMVLTGGPGTGKTTTTQGIISAYKAYGLDVLLAAPTGRAAKRMTEATGLEAKTIYRLLECKPPEGYQKNEENPSVGATNLNLSLQEALNPSEHEIFARGRGAITVPKDCLRRSGFAFRTDDKVMQIKNNYDKEVFNGDIGMIETVNVEDRSLKVNFDGRIIDYDITDLDELVHAYATTIHKAQGSEYPIVVMSILMNHYVMLQRNLIYTGITRAKKILVMVGTKKALSYAVRNVTVTKRNTLLKERLL